MPSLNARGRSAPGMQITGIANVYRLFLDAMASLCSGWARVDGVTVVETAADGKAFDDLETHLLGFVCGWGVAKRK